MVLLYVNYQPEFTLNLNLSQVKLVAVLGMIVCNYSTIIQWLRYRSCKLSVWLVVSLQIGDFWNSFVK